MEKNLKLYFEARHKDKNTPIFDEFKDKSEDEPYLKEISKEQIADKNGFVPATTKSDYLNPKASDYGEPEESVMLSKTGEIIHKDNEPNIYKKAEQIKKDKKEKLDKIPKVKDYIVFVNALLIYNNGKSEKKFYIGSRSMPRWI